MKTYSINGVEIDGGWLEFVRFNELEKYTLKRLLEALDGCTFEPKTPEDRQNDRLREGKTRFCEMCEAEARNGEVYNPKDHTCEKKEELNPMKVMIDSYKLLYPSGGKKEEPKSTLREAMGGILDDYNIGLIWKSAAIDKNLEAVKSHLLKEIEGKSFYGRDLHDLYDADEIKQIIQNL